MCGMVARFGIWLCVAVFVIYEIILGIYGRYSDARSNLPYVCLSRPITPGPGILGSLSGTSGPLFKMGAANKRSPHPVTIDWRKGYDAKAHESGPKLRSSS